MRVSSSLVCLIGWAVLLSLLALLPGCKDKPPRFPEDHARFERIVEAVEALRQAYEEKDEAALRELMLPLENLQRLELEIQKDFRSFQDITLKFAIERMVIQGERARVHVRWEGEWTEKAGRGPLFRQGHGVLIWSGKQVILLADVEGDLPFGMANRIP